MIPWMCLELIKTTIKNLEIIALQKYDLLQATEHLPMRMSSLYVAATEES